MLHKWTPQAKYVQYQHFPSHFRLPLSLECSGEISPKSIKSAYPKNSIRVDIPSKIKCDILARNGS